MARSLSIPQGSGRASVDDAASGSRFRVSWHRNEMIHALEQGGLAAEYPAAYAIGSGRSGRSYAVRVGDALFESPVSYYADARRWGLSPGYARDRRPGFDRPITSECLYCHSDGVRPKSGSVNRFGPERVAGISCERCHGPGEAHAAHPSQANIINPARLASRARDSICEQCHLAGEVRIANPERSLAEFRAGQALEEAATVYVSAGGGGTTGGLKVVSHSEQLALSACARGSGGRLWCGTCHDPHGGPEAETRGWYRDRCLSCHGTALPAGHPAAAGDCIGCHMPRRRSYDGAHAALTDHRIVRRTEPAEPAGGTGRLRAWREPPARFAVRNLGLAYVGVGQQNGSAAQMQEGCRLLAQASGQFPGDPDLATGLGLCLMLKQQPGAAAELFSAAARQRPSDARAYVSMAAAREAANDRAGAMADLQRAIELDPSCRAAYVLLAHIYEALGRPREEQSVFARYLRFDPQDIEFRERARER